METVVIGIINCPNCGGIVRFERPAPKAAGSQYVNEIEATSTLHEKCGNCGSIRDIEITGNIGGFKMRILPSGSLQPVPHDVKYISSFNSANRGLESYYHALQSLETVIKSLSHVSIPMLHRMYLMQAFSNFEAFLYDSLDDFVTHYPPARLALAENIDALKEKKFSLYQIEKSPQLVFETLQEHLKSVSFHNFDRANSLFFHAMGIGILPTDRNDKAFLFKMLSVRHDCVHRNGLTQEGQPIEDPLPHISRLLQVFSDIAQRVQSRIAELNPTAMG